MATATKPLAPIRFGILLYGIPFLCLLLIAVLPPSRSNLNLVQYTLFYGNSVILLILSLGLGAFVDGHFRSNSDAPFTRVFLVANFVWSFLFVVGMMLTAYLAFRSYDASHHTHFLPPDVFSSWAAIIAKALLGTLLGGILFLPLNFLLMVLVRRHYRKLSLR